MSTAGTIDRPHPVTQVRPGAAGRVTTPLRRATLGRLGGGADVPGYDPASLTPAIVHIGVGGFHRSHQAVYLDDLARTGETGWGEIGVGLHSPKMRDALASQDWLFTVVERADGGDRARVIASMVDYLFAPDDPEAVVATLADARTKVVTLTITGGGYNVDDDGRFRTDDPTVAHDLTHPSAPRSVFGFLVAALARRRARGLPAFTVLSCDNVPNNGETAREMVVGFARLLDADLASWIDREATFPSSMVDRITPTSDDGTCRFVGERFGIGDRSPVVTEPFSQWVVEDDFCNGRPPLERVGVQFVDDVEPFKLVKTRLLNASHSAIGYLGYLAGYRTTAEAMSNPVFAEYVASLMSENIAPLLPSIAGVDVEQYQGTLLARFANARISDDLSRLCGRGSVKMPAYLLPSLIAARREGRSASLLTVAVAAWFCYLAGADLDGAPIQVADARGDELQTLVQEGGSDPRLLLGDRSIFGPLSDDGEFARLLEETVRDLREFGPFGAICGSLVTARLDAA